MEGSECEGIFSGHRKFLGGGEMWEGRGMSFLSCTLLLLLGDGCVGGFVSFWDICVGFSLGLAPISAVVLAFSLMYG